MKQEKIKQKQRNLQPIVIENALPSPRPYSPPNVRASPLFILSSAATAVCVRYEAFFYVISNVEIKSAFFLHSVILILK